MKSIDSASDVLFPRVIEPPGPKVRMRADYEEEPDEPDASSEAIEEFERKELAMMQEYEAECESKKLRLVRVDPKAPGHCTCCGHAGPFMRVSKLDLNLEVCLSCDAVNSRNEERLI